MIGLVTDKGKKLSPLMATRLIKDFVAFIGQIDERGNVMLDCNSYLNDFICNVLYILLLSSVFKKSTFHDKSIAEQGSPLY